MTDKERIDRLEKMLVDLCVAIWRKENNYEMPWDTVPSLKERVNKIGLELLKGGT